MAPSSPPQSLPTTTTQAHRHTKRDGRKVHREHTATATSSSRSHGGCVIIHASSHNEQRPHTLTSGMQKSTAALRSTNALPPVVLLFTLPAHTPTHISPHRRRIPEQSIHSIGDTNWHVQQLDEKQSALVPGTLTHTTQATARQQRVKKSQVPVLPPQKGLRSQNPVRASVLSNHAAPQRMHNGVYLCLSVDILAEQLCLTRESKEENRREKDSTHANSSYHHTHAPRGMGALNHNTKRKTKQKAEAWDDKRTHSLLP
ncbi:hypothetical protein TCDM_09182 [Trypanosoma cruzi Dm28c]|uniref:Uncharacterized protein n=1 Tax=Trypanosoma cruzi Dm28c TaxID=1416333 RepID=V5B648_TRYCR|nr:hypothetical protein TCDM_09182 [Trypanosoma cruzi Dm28c]